MEVNKLAITVIVLVLLLVFVLYFVAGLICYATKGKIFGKVFHKLNKWHWPDERDHITIYNSGRIMTYCRYCDKRIVRVGRDWLALKDDKK